MDYGTPSDLSKNKISQFCNKNRKAIGHACFCLVLATLHSYFELGPRAKSKAPNYKKI